MALLSLVDHGKTMPCLHGKRSADVVRNAAKQRQSCPIVRDEAFHFAA